MLARHEFGPEGVEYVRAYLAANEEFGKRLGRLLLDHHNIEEGSTWAFVPADSPVGLRTAFETGGLFPKRDREWDEVVGNWLHGQVGAPNGRPRLLCVEDAYARRQDGWLQTRPDHHAFFCGDDVYDYATPQTPPVDLTLPVGGATWRPDVGIVTIPPSGLSELTNRQRLSPQDVEELAVAATAIIVGAWDDEGFFFWQPREDPADA